MLLWPPEKVQALGFEGKKSGPAGGSKGGSDLPHQGSSSIGTLRLGHVGGAPAQTYVLSSEPWRGHFPPQ